jgi:hypothetical protein
MEVIAMPGKKLTAGQIMAKERSWLKIPIWNP